MQHLYAFWKHFVEKLEKSPTNVGRFKMLVSLVPVGLNHDYCEVLALGSIMGGRSSPPIFQLNLINSKAKYKNRANRSLREVSPKT